jgi:hypothetical protein
LLSARKLFAQIGAAFEIRPKPLPVNEKNISRRQAEGKFVSLLRNSWSGLVFPAWFRRAP